ncbi:MAG: cyclic nucleotide-binding domain-containing protein [Ilumatobacteraceae bacterium]|nr:cyclic nucleotide-binding domain-containing protein [Ilumatobacteraceae bacterium]
MRRGGAAGRIVTVAVIASITQIALTIAYTSLTFRDELSPQIGLGLTAMLLGVLITAAAIGRWSGVRGHVAGPQDSGLVVLSVVAPTIAATADAPGETIVVLMGLSSLAVGLTMMTLGRSGLGRMIRYLPYPVLAGFLAGTGLVMARAVVEIGDRGISGDAAGGGDRVARFAVVLVVVFLMTAISRSRLPNERFVPPIVLGSIALYHAVALAVGVGRISGAERGWLLPVLPDGALISGDTFTVAGRADWAVVADHLPALLPLLLLAPLTVLLYLGALETILDVDIDTDREFQVMGGAGAVAGLFGSAPSYTQFANTMLVQRMVGPVRAVPIAIGGSAVAVLLLGDRVVGLIPQPVVAGMLGFIAVSFVLDWTWDLRNRVGAIELALAAAVSIPVFGFLAGVGFGLVLTSGWFIVQYSRISGVRRIRNARRVRSNAYRSVEDDDVLVEAGRRVLIVELEGFLFFGIGDVMLRSVTERADSARHHDVDVVWVAANAHVQRALSPLMTGERWGTVEVDLDRALAAVEDQLLAERSAGSDQPKLHLLEMSAVAGAEQREFGPGDALIAAGEPVDGLLVIEQGRVSVLGGAPGTRLRQLGPGAVLGELSLYGDRTASATVVADEPVITRHVGLEEIDRLERTDPTAAAALHRELATLVAERLRTANDAVDSFRGRHDRGPDSAREQDEP